jgi:hypothetical protein
MRDLQNSKLIYLKGFLFLGMGIAAAVILLLEHPEWTVLILLLIAVWSFSRFYYFAFYVSEKYVDSTYRFSGLLPFIKYMMKKKRPIP